MKNSPEIADLLSKIRTIASQHKLTDVQGVVTVPCRHTPWPCHPFACPRCHGTGRVLRDMSAWPDGALAGAIERMYWNTDEAWNEQFYDTNDSADDTDDLTMTQALLTAVEATYG